MNAGELVPYASVMRNVLGEGRITSWKNHVMDQHVNPGPMGQNRQQLPTDFYAADNPSPNSPGWYADPLQQGRSRYWTGESRSDAAPAVDLSNLAGPADALLYSEPPPFQPTQAPAPPYGYGVNQGGYGAMPGAGQSTSAIPEHAVARSEVMNLVPKKL
jgi:hypothetical protein